MCVCVCVCVSSDTDKGGNNTKLGVSFYIIEQMKCAIYIFQEKMKKKKEYCEYAGTMIGDLSLPKVVDNHTATTSLDVF